MKIRFYGVRGSVATPGARTVRYGGNTVCVDVRLADGTILVLDAGTGIRELGANLLREGLHRAPIHLLLTHLHWDHIIGLPFFAPVFQKDSKIHLYPLSNASQQQELSGRILFDGVHFPVRAADIPAHIDFVSAPDPVWQIGSAKITRMPLNHPGGAQGFRIDDDDGVSLCYLTDNELSPPYPLTSSMDELARFTHATDLLIHDAQYLASDMPAKKGWGHSTVDEVLTLGEKAETPHLVFFHHDPDRDDDALDEVGFHANAWLRDRGAHAKVTIAREGLMLDPDEPPKSVLLR